MAARVIRIAAKVMGGRVSTPTLITVNEELQMEARISNKSTGRKAENLIMVGLESRVGKASNAVE